MIISRIRYTRGTVAYPEKTLSLPRPKPPSSVDLLTIVNRLSNRWLSIPTPRKPHLTPDLEVSKITSRQISIPNTPLTNGITGTRRYTEVLLPMVHQVDSRRGLP